MHMDPACRKQETKRLVTSCYLLAQQNTVTHIAHSEPLLSLHAALCAQGKVLLDGTDLQELNVSWLRAKIGLVGQEPVLFDGTVAENIRYGKTDASMEDVIQACQMANAHDFIKGFSDGYDTSVGTGGSKLSGGQKQRIAIARTLVKKPQILLLDEATSALDNESERLVQAALDSLLQTQRRTTLIIAHRLTTIRNADKIVVVDEGKVAEQGTHDELVKLKGKYAVLQASSQ
ncbi:hypothetical protein CYMTET_32253 [Cymbomonas tetramitiformis]|uniref:ABC transporter domain-containing protein n=1 Tax=Cymbomonas tetramitiformis TaxID=36881 RepID=A0AAE0FFE2_9CHLO|nr:hypothetical protein CYMTET_32253 [Cymbomonas tetramitiformis]